MATDIKISELNEITSNKGINQLVINDRADSDDPGITRKISTLNLLPISPNAIIGNGQLISTAQSPGSEAVNTNVIQDSAITTAKLAANSVTGNKVQSATLSGSNIASATLSGSNIASATLSGSNIASRTLSGSNIALSTITGSNIASATLSGSNIASATLSGSNIALSTITSSNIAPATIAGSNIASATIAGSNIASATIAGSNIASATIAGSNIASATIAGSNILSNTISGSNISTTTNIAVSSLSAQLLNITNPTTFNSIRYNWPSSYTGDRYLKVSPTGVLTWDIPTISNATPVVNQEVVSVGTIMPWISNSVPQGYLRCDGSYISGAQYPGLAIILGSTFGPITGNPLNGTDSYKLPDLRGKIPVGVGTNVSDISGNLQTFTLGSSGGEYLHLLNVGEIPNHTHTVAAYNGQGDNTGLGYITTADLNGLNLALSANYTTNPTGSGQAHNNIQPYLSLHYIIKAIPDKTLNFQLSAGPGLSASGPNNILTLSGGVIRLDNTINVDKAIFADGTATAPSITNSGDLDTGIYFPADNEVGISCSGTYVANFQFNEQGGQLSLNDTSGGGNLLIDNYYGASRFIKSGSGNVIYGTDGTGTVSIMQNNAERIRIANGGNVGIGTSSPNTKLHVSGGITVSDGIRGAMKDGGIVTTGNAAPASVVVATNIPSWATRITIVFTGVFTSGTKLKIFQTGSYTDPSTFVWKAGAYYGTSTRSDGGTINSVISNDKNGIVINSNVAADILNGIATFTFVDGETWLCNCSWTDSSGNDRAGHTVASFDVPTGWIYSIRINTQPTTTDTFGSGGTFKVYYEG